MAKDPMKTARDDFPSRTDKAGDEEIKIAFAFSVTWSVHNRKGRR